MPAESHKEWKDNNDFMNVMKDVLKQEEVRENIEKSKQYNFTKKITLFCSRLIQKEICCLCRQQTYSTGFDFAIDKRIVCFVCVKKLNPELIDIQEEAYKYGDWLIAMCESSFKNVNRD